MHAKGPAELWEKKIGPFVIRERQRRFREAGEGHEVRFVFGLDVDVRLFTCDKREEAEAWVSRVISRIASSYVRDSFLQVVGPAEKPTRLEDVPKEHGGTQ